MPIETDNPGSHRGDGVRNVEEDVRTKMVKKPVPTRIATKSASSDEPNTISGLAIGKKREMLVVALPRKR